MAPMLWPTRTGRPVGDGGLEDRREVVADRGGRQVASAARRAPAVRAEVEQDAAVPLRQLRPLVVPRGQVEAEAVDEDERRASRDPRPRARRARCRRRSAPCPRSSGGSAESSSCASGSAPAAARGERRCRPITPPATRAGRESPAVTIAVGVRSAAHPDVLPRNARADRRHDLVADRPDVPGELLRRDPLVALLADQDDLVTRATSSSPQSTRSWSIVTVPATGCRRPPDQHLGPRREPRG